MCVINNRRKSQCCWLLHVIDNISMWLKTYVLFDIPVVSKIMSLNTSISDGNRIFFQVYPARAFLKLKYSI
jgi:hypothetical protein